ncbi:hypothetical protein EDB81DRAFT_916785 [Dactylonectria macrodidyma]|uniref:CFEM domain-containing protein n=1 Tax=Dactylonectria macrodidyma TaxID=307937 RepID=A0A9P9ICD1_9HYPO|nr:hypothetical protein EDB81DRAFT_916785 [Dactylonectria macrodidyma]
MKAFRLLFLWVCFSALPQMTFSSSVASKMPDCASKCLGTAIADSACTSTNQTCLCSNEAFKMEATSCIMKSCSAKESLVAKNLTMTDCGAPVRDRSRGCVIETITLTIISTLLIIQRFSFRIFWNTPIWFDDWLILFCYLISFATMFLVVYGIVGHGLGRDVWTLSPSDITEFGKYLYALSVVYITAITMLKLSLLFFYLRIFPTTLVRRILWGTIIFNAISGVLFCFVLSFQCLPISYYWTRWDGEHQGHCANINAISWSYSILSISIDIWMLIIPLSQLPSLNLNWKKKVGAGIMFCVGTFVTIISILRLRSIIKFSLPNQNPTWNFVGITTWSILEANVGIICACLPSLRLHLARILPNILGTSQQHSSSHTGRNETGLSSNMDRVLGTHTRSATVVGMSRQRSETEGIACQRVYASEFGDNDETHLVSMRDLDQRSSRSDISL